MSRQIYVSFIVDELTKGNVDAGTISSLFCRKFQKTERTFFNHWEEAKIKHSEQRDAIEKAKLAINIESEIKAVTIKIKTKEEIFNCLNAVIEEGSNKDKLKAIDIYNKMLSYYTPILSKVEISQYEDWNDEQLIKELKRLETK